MAALWVGDSTNPTTRKTPVLANTSKPNSHMNTAANLNRFLWY